MTNGYTPQAGTLAARVLAHFAALPDDAELANQVLADSMATDPNCMTPCLQAPMRHGLLDRFKRDGRVYWRRGHRARAPDTPPPDEEAAEAEPDLAVRQVRVDASAAAAPIEGLSQQSWCPAAQEVAADVIQPRRRGRPRLSDGSLDEPPEPPHAEPAPPPLGLGWKAPHVPVYLGEPPAPAPVPGPDRVLHALEEGHAAAVRAATAPTLNDETAQALAAALVPEDPDFREVERAPIGESAVAGPPRLPLDFWCALRSDGQLHIERRPGDSVLLTADESRLLIRYVSETLSARARAAA